MKLCKKKTIQNKIHDDSMTNSEKNYEYSLNNVELHNLVHLANFFVDFFT